MRTLVSVNYTGKKAYSVAADEGKLTLIATNKIRTEGNAKKSADATTELPRVLLVAPGPSDFLGRLASICG